jgi:hypothetical protein
MSIALILSIIVFIGIWILSLVMFGFTFEIFVVGGVVSAILSVLYYILLMYIVYKDKKRMEN